MSITAFTALPAHSSLLLAAYLLPSRLRRWLIISKLDNWVWCEWHGYERWSSWNTYRCAMGKTTICAEHVKHVGGITSLDAFQPNVVAVEILLQNKSHWTPGSSVTESDCNATEYICREASNWKCWLFSHSLPWWENGFGTFCIHLKGMQHYLSTKVAEQHFQ